MSHEALQAAGLTKNESKVYEALLKFGSASANEIAKKSGVHRINVYDCITRLVQKGLVSSVMKTNKRYYEASNPKELLKILELKQEQVEEALPHLLIDYNLRKEKQEVHFFRGPEGVITAYYMILDQKQPLYALGGSGLNRKYLKHRHIKWDKERIKLRIPVNALYYESYRKDKIGTKYWKIKYLPDKFKNPAMIDICGNLVVILLASEDIMAIVIENKAIADAYRKYFNFMWQFAKN